MKNLIKEIESTLIVEEETIGLEEGFCLTYKYVDQFSSKFYSLFADAKDVEDITHEIYTKFLEKGFFQKYNSSTTSKKYFVMSAVRNSLIDMLRKQKDVRSLDQEVVGADGDSVTLYNLLESDEDIERDITDKMYQETLIDSLSNETNSKVIGKSPLLGEMKMTERNIAKHLLEGYSVVQIADMFINPNNGKPVSSSSISKIVKEVRANLKINMEYITRL